MRLKNEFKKIHKSYFFLLVFSRIYDIELVTRSFAYNTCHLLNFPIKIFLDSTLRYLEYVLIA